jgi:hypothetical protein
LTIDLENTAPRISVDFTPQGADVLEGLKKKIKRRERKLKRMIAVLGGFLVMAYMIYLITVTSTTRDKVWDPYEILGISTVRRLTQWLSWLMIVVGNREGDQITLQAVGCQIPSR